MSSDTVPIMQSATPPSYVESQRHHNISQCATTNQPLASDSPPPYSPPTYVLESSGPSYQRFGVLEGPVNLVSVTNIGKDPCLVTCPCCEKQVVTVTSATPGALTCLMSALCLFIFLPCAILPFCIDDLQDVSHSCPVCHCFIGTYTRL